jgi:outer membrane biosynthesis protein TonB
MPVVSLHQNNTFHNDPKFGRLLLLSLIVHGLIWIAFSVDLFGTNTRPKPPVYYVDLIHKPVLNPQAGRPDPRPASKPKPAPVKRTAQKVAPPAPKAAVKPAVKPLVKPTTAARPKPAPKAVSKPDQRKEQKVQSALDEIRERQARQAERDALKDKLAKLRDSAGAAATVPDDVPVGMPDGQGDEVGVSALAFVQAFIQQNWALSPYLLDQSRLAKIEAKATLSYSASGKLVRYRINTPSGDQQFDDSLKRAITKSQQLPQPLPQDLELVVTFNLKEMAARR